ALVKELQEISKIPGSPPYTMDSRFNGFAKSLNAQFVEVESFLATQTDRSAIQKRVREIGRTCQQCHEIYRPKDKD
ncbi:MAG: cytochrome c, partial [bacterium]